MEYGYEEDRKRVWSIIIGRQLHVTGLINTKFECNVLCMLYMPCLCSQLDP